MEVVSLHGTNCCMGEYSDYCYKFNYADYGDSLVYEKESIQCLYHQHLRAFYSNDVAHYSGLLA